MTLFGKKSGEDQQEMEEDDGIISTRPLSPRMADDKKISGRLNDFVKPSENKQTTITLPSDAETLLSTPKDTVASIPVDAPVDDDDDEDDDYWPHRSSVSKPYVHKPFSGFAGYSAWAPYDPTPKELSDAQINEKIADVLPDWIFEKQDHGFVYTYPASWKKRDLESGIWVVTPLPNWAGDRNLSIELLHMDNITSSEGVGGYATGPRTARQECLVWLKHHDWQWKDCVECTDGFVVEDFDNLDMETVTDVDICFFCDGIGQRWSRQWIRVRGVRVYSDKEGILNLKPGEYGYQESDQSWYAKPPGHTRGGCLSINHTVIEHPDKTITVTPSVVVPPVDPSKHGSGWHGLLTKGEWVKI